jgi:hypothetical protein
MMCYGTQLGLVTDNDLLHNIITKLPLHHKSKYKRKQALKVCKPHDELHQTIFFDAQELVIVACTTSSICTCSCIGCLYYL